MPGKSLTSSAQECHRKATFLTYQVWANQVLQQQQLPLVLQLLVRHLQGCRMVDMEVEQLVRLQVLMAPLMLFHMALLELVQVWQVLVQQQLPARRLPPQPVDHNFSLTVRFQSLMLENSTTQTRTPTCATRFPWIVILILRQEHP